MAEAEHGANGGHSPLEQFEVFKIRLTDFTHNNDALDLGDIVAVRFDFGATFGSSRGRLGIDDIVLSNDADPASRIS